jgi:hypothetical protein
MFNFNPDIMRVDGDEQPVRFVPTERNDTTQITQAEMTAASIAAARELAMTPYAELSADERRAMTQKEKMDYLQAAREEQARLDAEERAASNPMFDFSNRPEAPTKPGMIQYYSWIGDTNTGSWKLYSAPDTAANQARYGGRSVGGETQATPDSPVGANSLVTPATWNPETNSWNPQTTDTTTTTDTTLTPTAKTIISTTYTGTGKNRKRVVKYSDGTTETFDDPEVAGSKTIKSTTYTGSGATRKRVVTYSDGTSETFDDPEVGNSNSSVNTSGMDAATAALIKSLQDQIAALNKQVTGTTTANTLAAEQKALEERQRKENALTSLTARFSQYGLASLVPKIRELVINGSTEATIAFELQETPEYKQRFKANTERLKKGLAVLDAGTYIGMEDSYRQALRAYGLKQFDTDDYVSQFIANDISANELSNRIVTAVQRVQNADPAITSQLREFYNIGQNDLVAYVLDPNQQFQKIERQVQAAEIGVAARRQGLQAGVSVAEQLAAQGVTQAEAQKGYATIADILPDAKRLSDIYGTTLEGYDQAQGEQEVFNQLASAQRRRQKLTQREIAAFGGQSGLSTKALTTDLTGQY